MSVADHIQPSDHWYKGAIHVHTSRSDGRLSPEEVVRWHRAHGYDFLAVTDHNVLTDMSTYSTPDFLTIPAIELELDQTSLGTKYHLVALNPGDDLAWYTKDLPVQEAIDRLNGCGATVILAHPYWSALSWPEVLPLRGLLGIEIFNTSAHTDFGKGFSTVHWDDLLSRGARLVGFAVDDTHWINNDAGGGWVMVRASALKIESILQALREGDFYSTQGPAIYDLRLERDVFRVSCSPVVTINFIAQTRYGAQLQAPITHPLRGGEYHLRGNETFLRVECIDANGRMAWSNPIYLS